MVDGEAHRDNLLRVDAAVALVNGEPVGQAVDGVLMASAADVLNVGRELEVVDRSLVQGGFHMVYTPEKDILVHIHLPHGGTHGAVAVEVLDVAHGDVDVVLVDFAILHIEVDEQLVVVEAPVEVHLGQQATLAHWCDVLVGGEEGVEGVEARRQCQGLNLFHHGTVGGTEYLAVVDGEVLFHDAVAVLHLFAEGQPGHEAHLVAVGGEVIVGFHQTLRQRLLEEHQLVDAAAQHRAVPGTANQHVATQAAERVGGEGIHQVAVDIDGGIVQRAVHRQHIVVPAAVGEGAGGLLHQVAVTEAQASVLDGYQRAVESVHALVAALAPARREERHGIIRGAEPEHQGVVLNVGTREDVLVEAHGLCAVEVEGEACGSGPGEAVERKCRAAGLVGAAGATTLVHGIVGRQFALVTRQAPLVGLHDVGLAQGLNPHTSLQHIAAEAVTEDQRGGLGVES